MHWKRWLQQPRLPPVIQGYVTPARQRYRQLYSWNVTKNLYPTINACCESKLRFLKRKSLSLNRKSQEACFCSLFLQCTRLYHCSTHNDVQWNAQGRNKAIVLGQVGIRCKWCSRLPTWSRSRGAVYYSATLDGLYQAAQNMAKNHLCKHCRLIPQDVRDNLTGLRDCKRRAAGGKKYWAEGAKVLGVYQCEEGLRFKNSTTCPPIKESPAPTPSS